jgi:hypothetical protein
MSDEKMGEPKQPDQPGNYAVILPCKPEDFREFVSGLLGKPQTITGIFHGPFDLARSDLENFHHLLVQRVHQQNDGTLLQFNITISYDDDSTVLLNDFNDFVAYNEVSPLASIAANLSWTFLVRFQDRNVPEKQQIDLSIVAQGNIGYRSEVRLFGPSLKGYIHFRISHTARTWGSDIEALLKGHIEGLIKPIHPVKKFLRKNSGWVGFTVGTLLFLASIASTFYSTQLFLHRQMAAVSQVSAKTDYLVELVARGVWPRFFFYVFCFITVAFVASVFLGVWAASSAETDEPSFLLLSKQAERLKSKQISKYNKGWRLFALSLITGTLAGIVGNVLFAMFLRNWLR